MAQKHFIATDLGASNGRLILGRFDGRKLALEELNRFPNHSVRVRDSYYWDILSMFENIQDGLRVYAKGGFGELSGIGIDTWGVDFWLIDKQGNLTGNPLAYRDPRSERGMKAFFAEYGERAAFDLTGVSNMPFNTLFRLYDMTLHDDPQLKIADKLLLFPDLLGYMLSGAVSAEYTHATTTQMLGMDGQWSSEILDMIGISKSLMPQIQASGTVKGTLLPSVRQETGVTNEAPVYCVGAHDTASAVASIPVKDDSYAFLSSGTWSLVGIVTDKAMTGDTVFSQNFSNEGTVDGRYRLLRNIMGLWIVQGCKQQWDREERISWDDIVKLAEAAPAFRSFIDVNAHMFYGEGNMIEKIQRYCESTGQPVPQSKGEIARTVYESLAMGYREAFEGLEQLKGSRINVMHIVGGGSKNKLLNRMTAGAIGREVIAGPVEATAIGNLMVQVRASGEITGDDIRQVISDSFGVESFEPLHADEWTEQYTRFIKIKAQLGRGSE